MNRESLILFLKKIKRKKWPVAVIAIVVATVILIPIGNSIYANYKRFSVKNPMPLSEYFVKKTDREKIHLTAHRGYSAQAPENTLPTVKKAEEYNFDSIEFDVRQTQDGVWVVSHDANVKSMTNKSGKISSYTYYDLVTCKIDNGANHKDYDNLTIPTLEQMLKACLESNIKPMIEIKDYTDDGIESLTQIIDKNGFTDSCCVISFDREALEKVRKSNGKIKLYALVSKLTKKEIQKCLEDTTIGVSFDAHQKTNNNKKIDELKSVGVPLICWTVDDEETMQKYFDWGITEFVTNRVYK